MVGDHVVFDQYRIDSYTDKDQKSLESKRKERPYIVVPDLALLPVSQCCERDRRKAGHEIDFDHSGIDDDKHECRQDHHHELHDECFQEQPQKLSELHGFQRIPHCIQIRGSDRRGSAYQPPALVDHMLRNIKNTHNDVESVRHDQDGYKGLEDPFKNDPRVQLGKVVMIRDQLDQFITGDKRQDHARNGQDHRLGDVPDHGKNRGREVRGGGAYLPRDTLHLFIHGIEEGRQVPHTAVDEYSLQPFRDFIE